MTCYINSEDIEAIIKIKNSLKIMLQNKVHDIDNQHIVILCIGTDRVTGDSLGPFVGQMLKHNYNCDHNSVAIEKLGCSVYGTIHEPIHAKNLATVLDSLYCNAQPVIIAVDAALGSSPGSIVVADRGLLPGDALGKELPKAGDISIKGIVNYANEGMVDLQNTRLSTILNMSEIIANGVKDAVLEIYQK